MSDESLVRRIPSRKTENTRRAPLYLCSLFRQVKGDTLADFGGQLTEHVSLETADHDLAQPLVQLLQVGRPPTVPLPARPEVPV